MPTDTLGLQLSDVLSGGLPAEPRVAIDVQLWGTNEPLLGIRTNSGLFAAVNNPQMVTIAGWAQPAEVGTYPSGAVAVTVYNDAVAVELVSRILDRAQLIAIAERLLVEPNGGLTVDVATLPSGWTLLSADSMVLESGVLLGYTRPTREGTHLDVNARSQTAAGRGFERIIEPPVKSVDVNGTTADLYRDDRNATVWLVWVAAPNVQLRIEVGGGGRTIDHEPLAVRVARSMRRADAETWRTTLESVRPGDTTATTMTGGAPDGTGSTTSR